MVWEEYRSDPLRCVYILLAMAWKQVWAIQWRLFSGYRETDYREVEAFPNHSGYNLVTRSHLVDFKSTLPSREFFFKDFHQFNVEIRTPPCIVEILSYHHAVSFPHFPHLLSSYPLLYFTILTNSGCLFTTPKDLQEVL